MPIEYVTAKTPQKALSQLANFTWFTINPPHESTYLYRVVTGKTEDETCRRCLAITSRSVAIEEFQGGLLVYPVDIVTMDLSIGFTDA